MLSILCVRLTVKVKVGIPETFKVGKTGSSHLKHTVSCDGLSQMTTFLQQGWRLVEIFLDLSNAPKDHSNAATINLFWFLVRKRLFELTTLALFMKAGGVSSL